VYRECIREPGLQCEPAREPAILAREPAIPAREPAISAREPGSQNNCFGECLLSDCECILAILEGECILRRMHSLLENALTFASIYSQK